MRQSKTTLKELTAAYRAVLRYGILCNAVALGLAMAPAIAGDPAYSITGDVNLNSVFTDGVVTNDDGRGIVAHGETPYTASLTTDTININASDRAVETWYGSTINLGGENTSSVNIQGGNRGLSIFDPNSRVAINSTDSVSISGNEQQAALVQDSSLLDIMAKNITLASTNGTAILAGVSEQDRTNSVINIGNASTENITMDSKYGARSTDGATINLTGQNIELSSDDNTVLALAKGSQFNINGGTVDISTTSTDWAAVHAGNNTTNTPDPVATVNINADTINIEGADKAVAAMSQGIVNIDGDTTISGAKAIVARGNAQVYVNKNSNHSLQMDGDIDFDYDKATSGTKVDAIVDVTLNGENSRWTGNTVASYGTGQAPSEDYMRVNSVSLTMKDGATWNATQIIDNMNDDTSGFGYVALNNLNIDNSTINIADTERGIYVDNLIANNATITGGKMTVNKTADTINDRIDDYRSKIALANGSSVRADAKLASEQIDMFDIDAGSNITVAGLNILEDFNGSKTLSLGNAGNIAASGNVFTSLYQYDITGSNNGTLTIARTGTGGVAAAAGSTTDGARENVAYTVTGDDQSVTGAAIIRNADMTIVGQGTETSDNSITLADNLTVGANDADTSTLAIENAKFTGTGALVNEKNATLNIKDSLMGVRITNRGTLISDPTTYASTVDNSGYASFDNDTFASTAVLANTGVVDLKDVVFQSGAVISGNGRTNLVAGTTSFNNTMNANSLTLASGANFNGTVNGGSLDTRNGGIDSVSGSINNANLYVDASLRGNGSMDSFASTSGSSIKNINIIDSEYGTNSTMSIATGGATLADGYTITGGTNYYTDVKQDGSNIVFSDKLVNNSGMHAQLGSWGDGNYIVASNAYDSDTNSYTAFSEEHTVAAALTALDNQVHENEQNIISLQTDVANLQTVVGDATSGLVKDVADLQTAVAGLGSLTEDNVFTGSNTFADGLTVANGTDSTAADYAAASLTTSVVSDESILTISGTDKVLAEGELVSKTGVSVLNAQGEETFAVNNSGDVTAHSVTLGNKTVSGIDTGTTAQTSGGNSTVATVATVLKSGEKATFTADTTPAASLNGATTIGSAINNVADAVDTLNAGAGVAGSVDNKVAAATTMKIDNVTNPDGGEVKPFQNFNNDTSVVNAVAALDRHMGTVHGLVGAADATETTTHREYHGNLATGTTVEDHLLALDSSIGDMRDFNTTNTYATSTDSVAMNLKALDKAIADQSSLALVSANAYTDERIDKLDKDLSAGIASAVALSSVATTGVQKGEVAVSGGYGYYNGQSAAAFGAAMGLTNRWSVNAGAGLSNADVSFRAGTSYKFKLF